MTLPIAHLGEWYFNILYAGPVLIFLALLAREKWRERKRLRREGAESPPEPPA